MPRFLLPLLLLLAGEAAAVACSCAAPPTDPAERRALAREVARDALALVEVDVIAPYDERLGRGERVRIRRMLAGRARPVFEVDRRRAPSSAACDVQLRRGDRKFVLLYPPRTRDRPPLSRARPPASRYSISDSCTGRMLADKGFRNDLVRQMLFRWR